jgi:hypothetical protein
VDARRGLLSLYEAPLGGMAAGGILGMFVGGTLLALGYQIFMGWVATNPDGPRAHPEGGASQAD